MTGSINFLSHKCKYFDVIATQPLCTASNNILLGNSHTYRPILRTPYSHTSYLRFACNCYPGSQECAHNYITRQDWKCAFAGAMRITCPSPLQEKWSPTLFLPTNLLCMRALRTRAHADCALAPWGYLGPTGCVYAGTARITVIERPQKTLHVCYQRCCYLSHCNGCQIEEDVQHQ